MCRADTYFIMPQTAAPRKASAEELCQNCLTNLYQYIVDALVRFILVILYKVPSSLPANFAHSIQNFWLKSTEELCQNYLTNLYQYVPGCLVRLTLLISHKVPSFLLLTSCAASLKATYLILLCGVCPQKSPVVQALCTTLPKQDLHLSAVLRTSSRKVKPSKSLYR